MLEPSPTPLLLTNIWPVGSCCWDRVTAPWPGCLISWVWVQPSLSVCSLHIWWVGWGRPWLGPMIHAESPLCTVRATLAWSFLSQGAPSLELHVPPLPAPHVRRPYCCFSILWAGASSFLPWRATSRAFGQVNQPSPPLPSGFDWSPAIILLCNWWPLCVPGLGAPRVSVSYCRCGVVLSRVLEAP